ncbi:hypothetical protein ACHWQZ_G006550 [Mnemiopsis leidyi]
MFDVPFQILISCEDTCSSSEGEAGQLDSKCLQARTARTGQRTSSYATTFMELKQEQNFGRQRSRLQENELDINADKVRRDNTAMPIKQDSEMSSKYPGGQQANNSVPGGQKDCFS